MNKLAVSCALVNGRPLTSRAAADLRTNEAGGSHLEGVSRLSPTMSPQVAALSGSYDFTS
jgi:hypothetical protein